MSRPSDGGTVVIIAFIWAITGAVIAATLTWAVITARIIDDCEILGVTYVSGWVLTCEDEVTASLVRQNNKEYGYE